MAIKRAKNTPGPTGTKPPRSLTPAAEVLGTKSHFSPHANSLKIEKTALQRVSAKPRPKGEQR